MNKGGPKPAIVTTAALLLVGNWLRYAGTRANGGIFGLAMFGQILIGFAQPFCLCAPTRYSDLWFSDQGRTSATAVASLANPLGAALGQLIDGEWATKPSDIPNMVLYITIIVRAPAHPLPHHPRLTSSPVQRRCHPIVLPPSCTTHPSKRVFSSPTHAARCCMLPAHHHLGILADPDPLLRLRGFLQQRLIPAQSDPQSARLFRNRSRHCRCSPHHRRPGNSGNHVPNHRSL